jgi:aryl-alcohol dehydrogenase-like predicted oxidoreductase
MAQVAVAWVLSKDGVQAPIVGSTSVKHLLDILGTFK